MDKEQFIRELNELLAEEFEVEVSNIQPSKSIKMTLALDSLSLIDLVAVVEHTYKVKISGQEIANVKVFSDLYEIIFNRLEK